MTKKVFIRFWLLLTVSMATLVVDCKTKKEVWKPIVRYADHDIMLGMSRDEVRKYFGIPNDSLYQVGTKMGIFDLSNNYYISGKGVKINGKECSGSINFFYRNNILQAVQLWSYFNSTNIDKAPSFNGIRYCDTLSAVAKRFGINTLVRNPYYSNTYDAHYYFADENEDGILEFIPPSLSEAQIKKTEMAKDVYTVEDLRKYKSVYKLYLSILTTDDGEYIITEISFLKN